MVAHGHDLAVFQQDDIIQFDDGADALSHVKRCNTMGEFWDGRLHPAFGGGIQRAGAVVQDEDLGLLGQRAIDG